MQTKTIKAENLKAGDTIIKAGRYPTIEKTQKNGDYVTVFYTDGKMEFFNLSKNLKIKAA